MMSGRTVLEWIWGKLLVVRSSRVTRKPILSEVAVVVTVVAVDASQYGGVGDWWSRGFPFVAHSGVRGAH
jgi:hypothetical protein